MPLPTPEFESSEYKLILEALHAYLDDDDESYNDEIRELIHKIVTFHAKALSSKISALGYIPDLYEFLQRKGITYEQGN